MSKKPLKEQETFERKNYTHYWLTKGSQVRQDEEILGAEAETLNL